MARPLVCTIGHSTRPIDTFLDLLRSNEITRVLDVRTVPRSRHNPQFNRDALPISLDAVQIAYVHLPGLGGLRHARADSPNSGWCNLSFRGYADYMQSAEFGVNVQWVAGFWGTNVGLAMMVTMNLFPGGVLQVWDVVQNGYWHARSLDYIGSERSILIEWLRLPGDLVFILFGSVPLAIAAIKGYAGVRAQVRLEKTTAPTG